MNNVRLALVIAASLVVGCSAPSSSPTSPSPAAGSGQALTADHLAGTWNLVSIQPVSQSEQPKPAGADYTVTFTNDRVATRVDCNTCGGAFTLAGQTLTVGPALACTRAACPTMAFENTFTSLLSGESTVTVSSGVLVLSARRGTLRLVR